MKNQITLDTIIDGGSAPTLRPFQKEDWWAFAGCEDKAPEICYLGAHVVLLDGTSVGGFICHEGPQDCEQYSREYTTKAQARLIAETIITSREPTALLGLVLEDLN